MLAAGFLVRHNDDIHTVGRNGDLTKMFRALQFESRCGGHTRYPYSVLHHLLFGVALHGDEKVDLARAWAVHDLHECVTKDVCRAMKGAHTKEQGRRFDDGLLSRDDLLVNGKQLEILLEVVHDLDTTIINEEFHIFDLPGWRELPESREPLRPDVMKAIRKVISHGRKFQGTFFGAITDAPRRLSQWLTTSSPDCNVEYVLKGLECSERG